MFDSVDEGIFKTSRVNAGIVETRRLSDIRDVEKSNREAMDVEEARESHRLSF
jgi:hypothetical protein